MKKNIEIVIDNIRKELEIKNPNIEFNKSYQYAQFLGIKESSMLPDISRDKVQWARVIKASKLNKLDLNNVFKDIDLDKIN